MSSDIDFLVEFIDPLRPGVLDRFLALHSALRSILGHDVDLVERSAVENPILRQRIETDSMLVYAA